MSERQVGSLAGGGDIHVHYSPQVSAMRVELRAFSTKHSSDIVAAIQKERRQFRI